MFYLFLILTGLFAIYLMLGRMPLIRHINYTREPELALRFNQREDAFTIACFGFLFTLWFLSTLDIKYHFIY